MFPNAFTMLYLWDSISNKKTALKKLPFFHKVFIFDQGDAQLHGIIYRPIFFISDLSIEQKVGFKYLMSFIGTAHSDRYKICKKIESSMPKGMTTFFYLYLQAPWVYFARKLISPAIWSSSISEFKFKPLSKNVVSSVFDESFSILDIEHPQQKGLTMRTFDVLARGKKLITTNAAIKNEDFYNPNNVLIISRDAEIDFKHEFFRIPFTPLPTFFYEKYSLKGWIDEIFAEPRLN